MIDESFVSLLLGFIVAPVLYLLASLSSDRLISRLRRDKKITVGKKEVVFTSEPKATLENIKKLVDEMNRNPLVFISHSQKDLPFVSQLESDLSIFGVEVWTAHSEVAYGQNILERIEEAIASSQWILVVFSDNSVKSSYFLKEISIARRIESDKGRAFIIPLLIDNVVELPIQFRNKKFVDYRRTYLQPTVSLLETLLPTQFNADEGKQLLEKKYELLTPRQHAILRFLALNPSATTEDIGKEFNLSPSTIRNLLSKIYKRLRVNSRKAAIKKAQSLEFIHSAQSKAKSSH